MPEPETLRRAPLFRLLGLLFLGLGMIGLVLPLLPTTPFLLVSAGCFARSSPRWHHWLMSHPSFGPTLRDWEQHRCISQRMRWVALLSMLIVGGGSVGLALESPLLRASGVLLLLIGATVVLRIPLCPPKQSASQSQQESR